MKLSKEKRNQLMLVVFCAVAVLGLMWFNLIQPRYAALKQAADSQNTAEGKLEGIQNAIKRANAVTVDLTNVTQTLANAESDMASGDLYSWTYNTVRLFKSSYQVDIPDIGHPDVETMDLLPSFPFKQVRFTVTGTAFYHDLGKFIADFENKFPHIRIVNLQLQPVDETGGNEKLTFKMDVVALIQPTSS
jgi:Tfp pilus assembly protein PilO